MRNRKIKQEEQFQNGDICLVEWIDAGKITEWSMLDSIENLDVIHCRTVGFLVKSDGEKVILVQSLSDQENALNIFIIPQSCVAKMEKL